MNAPVDDKQLVPRAPGCHIAGRWEKGEGEEFSVINPATEEEIARLATASVKQVDKATAFARSALLEGHWSRMAPRGRSRKMHALVDRFEARRNYFADLVVEEVGTPIRVVHTLQIQFAIGILRFPAGKALTGPRGRRGTDSVALSRLLHEATAS